MLEAKFEDHAFFQCFLIFCSNYNAEYLNILKEEIGDDLRVCVLSIQAM